MGLLLWLTTLVLYYATNSSFTYLKLYVLIGYCARDILPNAYYVAPPARERSDTRLYTR